MRAIRDTMVVSPPLTMTREQIDELIELVNKCLDLERGRKSNGTNIRLWKCHDPEHTRPSILNAQRWIFDGITQEIRSTIKPDKCLGLESGRANRGTNVRLYNCNGALTQKWEVRQ